MKITFLGAVEEVTGSKYLIEHEGTRILVDCGLFQGPKEVNIRNRDPFPLEPSSIDAIVLTHAHVDHTGYIPALVKNGFKGPIYCSEGTYALSTILLPDSGFIQEDIARKIEMRGSSAQAPLYTQDDARHALRFFNVVDYDAAFSIKSLTITLIRSYHIIGGSFVIISDGKQTITFSGDLGRPAELLMKAPTRLDHTDFLVIESTYGDRLHEKGDSIKILGEIARETIARSGALIIPVFAVGRAQTILYCLHQLKQHGIIPDIPIFLDSPMAISVTEQFCHFQDEHKLALPLCNEIAKVARYTRTAQESKTINHVKPPLIIVVGSGMADGGRASNHFKRFISDEKNTIAFVGYQAKGTMGRALVDGVESVTIDDESYPVRAEIKLVDIFSAHADYNEILAWLGNFKNKPKKVFVTHGELASAQALKKKIEERFGWSVVVPKYLESFELD